MRSIWISGLLNVVFIYLFFRFYSNSRGNINKLLYLITSCKIRSRWGRNSLSLSLCKEKREKKKYEKFLLSVSETGIVVFQLLYHACLVHIVPARTNFRNNNFQYRFQSREIFLNFVNAPIRLVFCSCVCNSFLIDFYRIWGNEWRRALGKKFMSQ